AGTRFAKSSDSGRLREVVAYARAGDVAGEVGPGNVSHGFGPAHSRGLGRPVHGEGVVAVSGEAAVFDNGFDGAVVGAGDAGTEADHFIVEHEPGFFGGEGAVPGIELHAGDAVQVLQASSTHPVVRTAIALA